jgi:hypothetical protein
MMGNTVTHAAIVLAAVAPLAAPAPPSLAGKWVLNKEQSEDARTKVREAAGGGRPRGYEGAQGGMGGPGGGRMGGGFGGPGARGGERREGRQALQRFLEPPQTVTVTQSADEIAFDDGQAVYRLHPDGRKTKTEDGEIERTARWQGAELVVETKSSRGPAITTAYLRVPDKKRLHVTTRFETRSGETVTVRRVYDEAAAQ